MRPPTTPRGKSPRCPCWPSTCTKHTRQNLAANRTAVRTRPPTTRQRFPQPHNGVEAARLPLPYSPAMPRPTMNRTEATLRKLLAALPAPGYDLGTLSERGMYRLEAVSQARILRMLPYLKYRNANGAHICIRPTGESATPCWTTSHRPLSPVSQPKATAPPPWSKPVPATSRHGYATHSRFPRNSASWPRRRLPSSSAQTSAPPTGAGSDVHPALPTASRSIATLPAYTPSLTLPNAAANPFLTLRLFMRNCLPCPSGIGSKGLGIATATEPFHTGHRPALHSHVSATHRSTRDDRQLPTWLSPSSPVLTAGPNTPSRQSLRQTTFLRMGTGNAAKHTSIEP